MSLPVTRTNYIEASPAAGSTTREQEEGRKKPLVEQEEERKQPLEQQEEGHESPMLLPL